MECFIMSVYLTLCVARAAQAIDAIECSWPAIIRMSVRIITLVMISVTMIMLAPCVHTRPHVRFRVKFAGVCGYWKHFSNA